MTLLVVVLLAGLAVLTLTRERPAASRSAGGQGAISGWWLLAALLACGLLVRFGLSWLAVAGGVLLGVVRAIAPLLRLLPLFHHYQRQRVGGQGHAPPGADPASGQAGMPRSARMSRREALDVLGLNEQATREDVQREYKRLIKRLHPDLGGSTYLTAKLNEARDVLS